MRAVVVLLVALAVAVFAQDIPTSFDARQAWPQCTSQILDQGNCGSCWAFSATTSMTARFCIHGHSTMNKTAELSPQYLIDCNRVGQGGCGGGDTFAAYQYIQESGLSTLDCTPYTSGKTGTIQTCPTTCKNAESVKLYQGINHYTLVKPGDIKGTVANMQQELMKNGPFSVSFVVYSDFMSFFKSTPKGIYKHQVGGALGGHAVKLVGWGEEKGTPYWIIANSWSTVWGDNGYFRIVRGSNDCTIESRRVTAGLPKVNAQSIKYPLETSTVIDGARTKIAIDSQVLEVAKFAISEIAMSRGIQSLHGVKEAYAQVQNGIVYDLVLTVANANGESKDIETRVFRSALNKLTVTF